MFSLIILLLNFFLNPFPAHAFKADHFKGLYEVTGQHSRTLGRADKKYVVCDVDTVGNIWAKWASGDLPADLESIRNEPSILVGFTFRDGLFFNLEKNALVGPETLAMPGGKTDTMQLSRKGDGTFELGVRLDNVVTFYNLGPKQALPGSSAASNHRLRFSLEMN